ncbi:hypothetical protein GCM10020331_000260 [Ectobacillus funiculus]
MEKNVQNKIYTSPLHYWRGSVPIVNFNSEMSKKFLMAKAQAPHNTGLFFQALIGAAHDNGSL